ncbi:catalase [Stenotrophomonas acidaminiphila]|uniref:catalase n=1 Tax=Stenotrophomonas acidaminiphila TaxID=128780 RepID=UPI002ABDFD9E|nr:catalase [Stenotrophomonas acidaminiphila]WPU57627.1 catalase [Stenotrophomonas acidaminiphila]
MASKKGTPSHPPRSKDAARSDSGPAVSRSRQPLRPQDEVPGLIDAWAGERAHNAGKAAEYGPDAAVPMQGEHFPAPSAAASASTVSETNASDKAGAPAAVGQDANAAPLSRVRNDGAGRRLATNQGVPVSDNQHSLTAGLRGPALLKDFILREKITHFDHERIPERVVHARGSGAHGYFEAYEDLSALTRAAPFQAAGKITPVFARFSTVAGERGSKDTARDVRGFAVKFYTDEGNWDLVGNNMPVFFIQDAIKFPDLVHALKPEPHHGMPQAASAHDTFWDFVSLMPESTHMLMWQMSDRAIPRSYRTMQGFGVHTFRLVNARGESVFCKFHWTPLLGTHSLVWDEAVKISGADPDYHRRDLWEAIEAGDPPEYELGIQVFSEEEADGFSFDVLDATKIVPEELVPIRPVGRMVLNRNPDNFFAETEQVAFCTAHVIPGIDFSNDPLLAGRIHSYVDTQISRLGGPNFHELPINAPVVPAHNNQRDGMHRQAIHRGRVSYEPNSLAGGCPFQAGAGGFVSFAEPAQGDEVRARPEKFAEHYAQATLFYDSQSPAERRHIADAFRFELSKVTVPAVRRRVVSMLRNASEALAAEVARGLGMALPPAMPRVARATVTPEVVLSPALSLLARPGDGGIRMRRIALLVADGSSALDVATLHQGLTAQGAMVRLLGPHVGRLLDADDGPLDADASLENEPGVLFDALAVAGGAAGAAALAADIRALEHIRDGYRHGKPLLFVGAGRQVWDAAGIAPLDNDPLLLFAEAGADDTVERFVAAIARRRYPEREPAML